MGKWEMVLRRVDPTLVFFLSHPLPLPVFPSTPKSKDPLFHFVFETAKLYYSKFKYKKKNKICTD